MQNNMLLMVFRILSAIGLLVGGMAVYFAILKNIGYEFSLAYAYSI